ncbi:MAG: acetylxylan esterase, partial [Armatimonadetes bacterium]|nr:acetylxylan esterase [Armatimonadota bacterium]
MLYHALVARAAELSSRALATPPEPATWWAELSARRRQWLDLLGLDPLPERGDLSVVTTDVLDRGHYVIEKLHFQPLPGCRIAANIYRPKTITEPLPAVVYVCGHAASGKAWYQPHARWFGEHGYVCLILDTIEIGEQIGTHHGVYHQGWWHWFSQGYSPTAVEVWYAMRAADLLQARDDVDPTRLGITGNSGGGSVSWYTGAADERFGVVAPSCQSGTMEQHVRDRTLDGHCDCTVWVNNLGWDLTDVAALMAPRALLVASATEDTIWRPWSNRELFYRVRRLYRALGIEERFEVVEDAIPHGYSPKTRTAIFAWFERHLKGVEGPAEDIREEREADETLWAFPGGRPPADDRTPDIHRFFLPLPAVGMAEVPPAERLARLRAWTFRTIPEERGLPAHRVVPRGCFAGRANLHLDFE